MVLLTPVSKIKESSFPLISSGITIKLLINLNRTEVLLSVLLIKLSPFWAKELQATNIKKTLKKKFRIKLPQFTIQFTKTATKIKFFLNLIRLDYLKNQAAF